MTDTLPDVGQADLGEAPEPSPRQQHLAKYLEAVTAVDRELREAIAAELAERIPEFEQARVKAAAVLEETYGALQDPEGDLAELDSEIAGAETQLATWQSRLEDGDVAARVEARRWVAEWEAELAALRSRREYGMAQLLPLRDAHSKARAAFERANGELTGWELSATPAFAYFGAGQKSAGYAFRFGVSLEVALRERDHYEHDAAVEHMLHLCRVSGFRTESYAAELPSDAEQARRYWDQVHADAVAAAMADPVPGPAEVMRQTEAGFGNMALEQSAARNVIDDRRGARAQAAPPRRSYMQLPGRGAR